MRTSPSTRTRLFVSGFLAILGTLSSIGLAGAQGVAGDKTAAFAPLWSVLVTPASSQVSAARLLGLRASGVDALIVERGAWSQAKRARLVALAQRAKLRVLEPTAPPSTNAAATSLRAGCAAKRSFVDRCALLARTAAQAAGLSGAGGVDLVALHVQSPDAYLRLAANRSRRTRLVAIAPLTGPPSGTAWQRAIARAIQHPGTTLAVAPTDLNSSSLDAYLRVVAAIRGGGPGAEPGNANVWVDPNGGSCKRTAQAAAYNDGSACGSFNSAYLVAQPGDLILVKAGAYGSQTIGNRSNLSIGSTPVVFQPAPGESATFNGGMSINAHDVIVNGSDQVGVDGANRFSTIAGGVAICYGTAGGDWCGGGAAPGIGDRNNAFENINAESAFFNAWGSTLSYSDIGPLNVCDNRSDDLIKGWWVGQDETNPIHDLHIEFNLIHDNVKVGCSSGAHNDAIQFEGAGTIINGNRIWNCGTQCIFEGAGNPGNIIENNMVEETNACGGPCGDANEISSADPDVIVRYNTLDGVMRFYNPKRPSAHATVYGNVFLNQNFCDQASTYSYNIFRRGLRCGTHAISCTPRLATGNLWTDTDMHADYHLSTRDTCARGAGDPLHMPAFDIDGQRRPLGAVDAGADEVP
jgi:hypothetical protein